MVWGTRVMMFLVAVGLSSAKLQGHELYAAGRKLAASAATKLNAAVGVKSQTLKDSVDPFAHCAVSGFCYSHLLAFLHALNTLRLLMEAMPAMLVAADVPLSAV